MEDPKPPITPELKKRWNAFIDFVETQKMANNPMLDQRNKQLGMTLLQKFNMSNPANSLPMDIVPQVQQSLQDYRNNIIAQWKAKKVVGDGIKTEADIMPNISAVDGWPGTKTLSSRFPTASYVDNGVKKDYGVDTEAYDKEQGLANSTKSAPRNLH